MSFGAGSREWGTQSQDPPPCAIPDPSVTDPLLLGSYTRDHPLFLQLKDYFWVKTPSLYELPYGTKGSGKHDSALWDLSVCLSCFCSWGFNFPFPKDICRLILLETSPKLFSWFLESAVCISSHMVPLKEFRVGQVLLSARDKLSA